VKKRCAAKSWTDWKILELCFGRELLFFLRLSLSEPPDYTTVERFKRLLMEGSLLSFKKHLLLYVLGALLLFLLNAVPIRFDLDRASAVIWFPYPLIVWGFALVWYGLSSYGRPKQLKQRRLPTLSPEAQLQMDRCTQDLRALRQDPPKTEGLQWNFELSLERSLEQIEALLLRLDRVNETLERGPSPSATPGEQALFLKLLQSRTRLEKRLEQIQAALRSLRLKALLLSSREGAEEEPELESALELVEGELSAALELEALLREQN